MDAPPPVDHDAIGFKGERMVEAHRYFSEQAREWLQAGGPPNVEQRGVAIELVVRELLQMVVIDLAADENAQEIFETLNARGAQLTAADLIKNFIFQRLSETGADVEQAYERNWREFETAFWETEVSVGRLRYARSSIFLNHWLIARTGEEVVAREIFDRFKRFVNDEARSDVTGLLGQVHAAAQVYRRLTDTTKSGPVTRLELFLYRTGVMESEIVKPLLLCLLDPEAAPVPEDQLHKGLDAVESWMVRRMVVRASTKSYNKVFGDLIAKLRGSPRAQAGQVIEDFLRAQTGESYYWPDDEELRRELKVLPAYRRLSRGRLRMVLEAIEDHFRGWRDGKTGLGGERVARGQYAIEHIMPRKWQTHWKLPPEMNEMDRERRIHTLGNLTLLTKALNSKVSNGPWLGDGGKREALKGHDVLFLNRKLLDRPDEAWTEDGIGTRTVDLCEVLINVWPAPEGHRADRDGRKPRRRRKIGLTDLFSAGVLQPPMPLIPRRHAFAARKAVLLSDGQIEVEGRLFEGPSEAATAITGKRTNGWWFFMVDAQSRRTLRNVKTEYRDSLQEDVEIDDGDDEEDGGED
jgi:hypothetical protein